MGAKGMIVRIW